MYYVSVLFLILSSDVERGQPANNNSRYTYAFSIMCVIIIIIIIIIINLFYSGENASSKKLLYSNVSEIKLRST